jgi:hypothetical protein
LHFPNFVKMDPKYLNNLLPLISMLRSSFVFCMLIPTLTF